MEEKEINVNLNDLSGVIKELNKDRFYIFYVEVGDMPKEEVSYYLLKVKNVVENAKKDSNVIYIPTHDGVSTIKTEEITELKFDKLYNHINKKDLANFLYRFGNEDLTIEQDALKQKQEDFLKEVERKLCSLSKDKINKMQDILFDNEEEK